MLEGDRIRLRPFTEDDARALAAMANDQRSFDGYLRHTLNSPAELAALVRQNDMIEKDRFTLAVVDRSDGSLVGSAHVYPAHARCSVPEIGLNIYPPEKRRKGYGFEVIALLTNLLFYTRPVPKVTIATDSRNTFLINALQAFSFEIEAVMREVCFTAGRYQDYVIVSLLRQDWERQKERPELARLRAVH